MTSRIPILMYHQVDTRPAKGTPMRGLIVSPQSFASQMAWLKRLGYQGLSMPHLVPYLRGEKTGKVVGISFDDGYANNLDYALPVLAINGFSATCYVVSNQPGGSNVWDHAKGIGPKPLMTHAHMRQWVAGGQDIGAHTCSHADLTTLQPQQALLEVESCKQQLEDAVGSAVTHFCYPYGHYDASHIAMVQGAGYETATTTQRGRANAAVVAANSNGLFTLPRVPVTGSTWWLQFIRKITTGYEDGRR